jgi:DNA repair protein RadC
MKTIKDMPEHARPREKLRYNHPSGEIRPSEADLNIHRQLTEAGKILGIQVLDHVIVARKGYYSFQEAGLLAHQT